MITLRGISLVFALVIVASVFPPPDSARAEVLAPNWIIYDLADDIVLDSEDMDERVAMASLTKVMTGLLVVENLALNDEITIVEEDIVGEASIWVEPDETYTVRTLLHGMMMRSGNDAAAALARAAGGSPNRESQAARDRFVDMMNERAAELGMRATSFANPHGLDSDGHYSTAYDLMLLTREVIERPRLMQAFGARHYSGEGLTFIHTNQLPSQYDGVLGGKTGWTNNAGLCLIQMVEKDGRILIVVLLGSTFERWYPDAIELLDYGYSIPRTATTADRAADAFEWWRERTDGPVERGTVTRSWLWGPEPFTSVRREAYREAVGGERMVQYFDKGRMEINDPLAPITSGWYVTGGHLARELISGYYQIGDDVFVYRGPAHVPVAGDPDGSGPTYADVAQLMTPDENEVDETITLSFDSRGEIRHRSSLSDHEVDLIDIDAPTGHGIASVFDEFLDIEGAVIDRGREVDQPIFSPRYALIGYPITEPVWMRVPVDGRNREVLVQCFERRCLTYTPSNDPDWQVEMGNIGQHYVAWQSKNRIFSLFDRGVMSVQRDRTASPVQPS
jgi:serine-type D-Ala-D-Ala carboxypeptidase (penicillin-binding protein 5/6)